MSLPSRGFPTLAKIAVAVVAGFALAACSPSATPAPIPQQCTIGGLNKIGGPIALVDETGAAVTEAAFAGSPTLIYFGFANCPDVCPMSLTKAAEAFTLMGEAGKSVRSALITLDPSRDTPESLGRFVQSGGFPPGLKGLTGSQEQIDKTLKSFAVYAQRVDLKDSAMGYVVDHSSSFYLMDANWKTRAIFPGSLAPEEIAACLGQALAAGPG